MSGRGGSGLLCPDGETCPVSPCPVRCCCRCTPPFCPIGRCSSTSPTRRPCSASTRERAFGAATARHDRRSYPLAPGLDLGACWLDRQLLVISLEETCINAWRLPLVRSVACSVLEIVAPRPASQSPGPRWEGPWIPATTHVPNYPPNGMCAVHRDALRITYPLCGAAQVRGNSVAHQMHIFTIPWPDGRTYPVARDLGLSARRILPPSRRGLGVSTLARCAHTPTDSQSSRKGVLRLTKIGRLTNK